MTFNSDLGGDPDYEPPPRWLGPIFARLTRLLEQGVTIDPGASRTLFRFLLRLEIEDFPTPAVTTVGGVGIELTWADAPKSLVVRARSLEIEVRTGRSAGPPGPTGRVRSVDDAREAFDWYCPRTAAQIRKEDRP